MEFHLQFHHPPSNVTTIQGRKLPIDVKTLPKQILRDVFGYPNFRGNQESVIEHVTRGGDALVLMPTGGGKSLCYQIPALCRSGVGIVISPLIALMQDQVDALKQLRRFGCISEFQSGC